MIPITTKLYLAKAMWFRSLIFILFLPCLAYPASQTKIVGTCVNDPVATNIDWTEPGDATADDGNNTGGVGGDRVADAEESDRLKGTMAGNVFTIPTDATIDSIRVEIDIIDLRNKDEGQDLEVRLIKAGSPVGNDESKAGAIPGVQTIRVYAPGNLWGTTWTPAQINATDFGIGYRVDVIGDVGRVESGIDFLKITVIYTPAAGGAQNFRRRIIILQQELGSIESVWDGYFTSDITDGSPTSEVSLVYGFAQPKIWPWRN